IRHFITGRSHGMGYKGCHKNKMWRMQGFSLMLIDGSLAKSLTPPGERFFKLVLLSRKIIIDSLARIRAYMSELPNHITVITKTPGLPFEDIDVVVTLPTFRRPAHLLQTLDSLKSQITDRSFTIVVIENEADKREGAQVAAPLFEAGEYSGVVRS